MTVLRTFAYVDALNLYHRALRNYPDVKWLDINKLITRLINPNNSIEQVNYYTTYVSSRLDPDAPKRQHQYLEALKTIPNLEIYHGNMQVKPKKMRLAYKKKGKPFDPAPFYPIWPKPQSARVWKHEEKGSDVNLASHLIRDAFQGKFDVAVVITNDTDLVEPIRIVKEEVGLPVGLLCPATKPAKSLEEAASFIRRIDRNRLLQSQFPEEMRNRAIKRPISWKAADEG